MKFNRFLNSFVFPLSCLFFSLGAPLSAYAFKEATTYRQQRPDSGLIGPDARLISKGLPPDPEGGSKNPVENLSAGDALPSFIGTEIINGLVEVENLTSRLQIGITVNLLGDSELVDWEAENNNVRSATLTLRNNELRDPDGLRQAILSVEDVEDQAILTNALAYLGKNSSMYETFWRPVVSPDNGVDSRSNFADLDPGQAAEFEGLPDPVNDSDEIDSVEDVLSNTDVRASDYFSLLRDRNVAQNLLLYPQELEYRLTIHPRKDYAPSPFEDDRYTVVSRQDVRWDIKVYEATVSEDPEIVYYRFAIRAVADPQDFLIPVNYINGGEIAYSASAYLVQENGQELAVSGAEGFGLNQIDTFTAPPERDNLKNVRDLQAGFQGVLDSATADYRPNRLTGLASLAIGEGQLSSLIGRALTQSPTRGNSIVSGGLVGFSGDSNPEALIGINQEIFQLGNLDAGLLFGATPESDTSIFVGPSLRYSVMTLGFGARIAGDDSLEVDPAGVISVDLSRVLADDSPDKDFFIVENPFEDGGSVGELASQIAQEQMFALVAFDVPLELDIQPEFGEGVAIDFVRLTTDLECRVPISPESPADEFRFTLRPQERHFRFLPQGCYRGQLNTAAMNVRDNYEFFINESGRTADETGAFEQETRGDTLQRFIFEFEPR